MLNRSIACLVLAFFLVLIADSAQPQRRSGHQPVVAQNAPTAQPTTPDQRGTDQIPLTVKVLPAPDAKEKAEKEDHERQEKAKVDEKLAFETQRIADYTDRLALFTVFLFCVAVVQAGFFIWQLRMMRSEAKKARINLNVAKRAANAAALNAQAVMDAEGAHLYPIIKKSNLKDAFQSSILHSTLPENEILPAPRVVYCFINYGRTPAVLEKVMHGMRFYPPGSTSRVTNQADRSLEIAVSHQETAEIPCDISEVFNHGKAMAVLEYKGELLFYGELFFRDFFNRSFVCYWEFDGRPDGFHLFKISERPNPNAKS
jgi:hypothetical protein